MSVNSLRSYLKISWKCPFWSPCSPNSQRKSFSCLLKSPPSCYHPPPPSSPSVGVFFSKPTLHFLFITSASMGLQPLPWLPTSLAVSMKLFSLQKGVPPTPHWIPLPDPSWNATLLQLIKIIRGNNDKNHIIEPIHLV